MRHARALVLGAAAGAVGTAAMDVVLFSRYRRGGGEEGPFAWETAEDVGTWDDASAPGQVGRKVVHALTGRDLPDRWARPTTNLVHWTTGIAWGTQYGLLAELTRRRGWRRGLGFGALVWLSDYVVLPLAGVYKPIWEYDARTLLEDLTAHLIYGAATGAGFTGIDKWKSGGWRWTSPS